MKMKPALSVSCLYIKSFYLQAISTFSRLGISVAIRSPVPMRAWRRLVPALVLAGPMPAMADDFFPSQSIPLHYWQSYVPSGVAVQRRLIKEAGGEEIKDFDVLGGDRAGQYLIHGAIDLFNVEVWNEYEVRWCAVIDMDSGEQRGVNVVVRPIQGRYVKNWSSGMPAAELYFDLNGNHAVDPTEPGYWIRCPDDTLPQALQEIQDTPYIIRTWTETRRGWGSDLEKYEFHQILVRPPVDKFNPYWGTAGYTASSIIVSKAHWCYDLFPWPHRHFECTGWQVGTGSSGVSPDGQRWPDGTEIQYGRNSWHAKDIAPYWVDEFWWGLGAKYQGFVTEVQPLSSPD